MLRPLLTSALDLLLPTACAGCGRARSGQGPPTLCSRCVEGLPEGPWPLAETPELLRSAWSWGDYQGPVGAALRRGKYRPDEGAMSDLGALLGAAAAGRLPVIDVVVPVPQRLGTSLQRGFSPVWVLADAVACAVQRPLCEALKRSPGSAQAGLRVAERQDNVRGAFRCVQALEGARVLLVDDVVTTGATARACAQELLCGGARAVHLLAACRAR